MESNNETVYLFSLSEAQTREQDITNQMTDLI